MSEYIDVVENKINEEQAQQIVVDRTFNNAIDKINFVIKKFPIVYAVIFGFSGTGKTNSACKLYDWVFSKHGYNILYFNSYIENGQVILDKIIDIIKSTPRPYVILDDLSFLFMKYKTELAIFLNDLMKIRHAIGTGAFVFITHYKNAILPVFRTAQIYVLTSLMVTDIERYGSFFSYDGLWRFLELQNTELRHYILLNIMNNFYIVPIGLSDTYLRVVNNGL